ncbi:uncharacterized protein LOC134532129 [Bacillus rossius redtenbacheri]|uniref:uncharacterized protein LOC134532129 n=1 Tax=Bacillus rossius redtenbacheri TaxID=93214 RepID=UPI002FDD03C2
MLDLPKSYERSRQLSVSSDRSGSSGTTAGYLTAAQSLRSSGSQGSGLWWSTLSLASARSEPPITRPDEEDTATPETPPGQRRDSATPWRTPLTGAGTADLGTTSDPRPQLPGGALPEIPAKHLASGTTEDENNRAFVDPQPTDLANTLINNTPVTQEDNSCLISSSNVQPRLLQGNPSTNSMIPEDSVRLSGTTEDESNLNPVHSNQMDVGNTSMTFSMGTQEDTPGLTSSSIQPQLLSENLPDISVTPDDALLSVGESGEDETNLPTAIPQPLLPRENMSIKNMLATQEDTSDLGSSDSEEDSGNDSKEPEAIAEEPKYEGARDEKATSLGFAAPFEAHVNPFIYTETYENEEHPKDVPVTLENSSYTKGYMGDFSKGNEYGAAFVEGKNDYHTHEENNTIFYQPKNKVHHISLEKSNDKTKMTESLSINSSVPTDVTMTGNHDLSFNEDVNNTTSADIAGEPEITDNLEVLGNSVEHFTNPNVSGESEEKECLLPENKTTNTKESNYVISRTTANSFGKPSERYSIIVSVPDEAGSSPTPFGLDLAALRDFPRACLLLGLALAQCADVNHAFFTPLMLAGDLAPLLLVVVAAADLAARVLLPVGLDGFHPSPRAVCLAGFLLLVASRTVLTLTMETSGMLMACVFLGASRGVKAAYLPTAAPADNFWTSLCLQMASQGVVFIVLGPLTGYLKDWNGSYDASVLAINIATVVGMLLCCVEYLRPAS